MKPTNIKIIAVPTQVQWECPHCGNTITMSHKQFCSIYGNSQWQYKETECMNCGETYYFNSDINRCGLVTERA